MENSVFKTIVNSIIFTQNRLLEVYHKNIASKVLGRNISGDLTRYIDLVSEKSIIDFLEKKLKSFSILSEETGFKRYGADYPLIIVDPLDGSFNAVKGIPFFSISIAVAYGDKINDIVFGAVCNVVTGDIYTGYRDRGAFINDVSLKGRSNTTLKPVISIAVSRESCKETTNMIQRFLDMGWKVRIMGSAALELCLVAEKSIDAYIDLRNMLRINDIAAGILILNEAGGYIHDKNIFKENIIGKGRYNIIATSSKNFLEKYWPNYIY